MKRGVRERIIGRRKKKPFLFKYFTVILNALRLWTKTYILCKGKYFPTEF